MTRSNAVRGLLVSIAAAVAFAGVESVSAQAPAAKPKPPTISKVIAKEVQAAQAAIKAEKWADCVAALVPTEAVPNKTPYDDYAVNELRMVCAARQNDLTTVEPALARALEIGQANGFMDEETAKVRLRQLLQVNYQLKNYPRAVQFGRRYGELDPGNTDMRVLTAQAIYLVPDYAGTVAYVEPLVKEIEQRGAVPPELAVGLWVSACVRLKDDNCTTRAVEMQAKHHPTAEAWNNLTLLLLRTAPQDGIINIWRFADEVGTLDEADYAAEYAQLALEKGFPGEAERVMQKSIAAGLFGPADKPSDSARNLQQTARTQATADRASLPRLAKEAAAQKTGQAEVRLGQAYLSYGQAAEAVGAIERGLAKGGVRNVPEANLSLGIARLRNGDNAGAATAFDAVKGDAFLERLARYWKFRVK